jgi:hypothetical protein
MMGRQRRDQGRLFYAARPVRRPRRVPPRRHRAEPQDAGAAPHPAATTARLPVSCVASVGGVSVEAEARMGEAKNPDQPSTCHIKPTVTPNGSRGRLFRQHRPKPEEANVIERPNS